MIFTTVLIVAALAALGGFGTAMVRRRHALAHSSDFVSRIKSVDLQAFRNLTDPSEREFLRANLSPSDFRAVQRTRLLATIAYVDSVKNNTRVLVRLGNAARLSDDPQVVASGVELANSALQLRLYCEAVNAKLYMGWMFPAVRLSPAVIADRYQQITGIVRQMNRMQYPSRFSRIPAAM